MPTIETRPIPRRHALRIFGGGEPSPPVETSRRFGGVKVDGIIYDPIIVDRPDKHDLPTGAIRLRESGASSELWMVPRTAGTDRGLSR